MIRDDWTLPNNGKSQLSKNYSKNLKDLSNPPKTRKNSKGKFRWKSRSVQPKLQ